MNQELVYKTKEEEHLPEKAKARVVDDTMKQLFYRDGRVTPETLLTEALKEDHPLHTFFEWNESKAAKLYRLRQATDMILASRFIVLLRKRNQETAQIDLTALDYEVEDKRVELRALLPDGSGGYLPREEVLKLGDSREYTINKRLGVLRSWCREVSDIEELSHIKEMIEKEVTALLERES